LIDPSEGISSDAVAPSGYRLQVLHEMMLNSLSWGVLAVLIVGEYDWSLRLFPVERNVVLEDRIDYNVKEFFDNYLDPGIMPPFEPKRDAVLVKTLYPKDSGTTIDLRQDNRAAALVEDLLETRARLKFLEKQEEEIKTELQAKVGENTFGLLADGRRLSWKHQHRKSHTVPASDFRVLLVLKEDAQ
jgi:predicted phage-related endonuclease